MCVRVCVCVCIHVSAWFAFFQSVFMSISGSLKVVYQSKEEKKRPCGALLRRECVIVRL